MKHRLVFLAAAAGIAAATAGCSISNEKVNVIKGAGMSNNSLMVGFNRAGSGWVRGFSASDKYLVVSDTISSQKVILYGINLKTDEKRLLHDTVLPNPGALIEFSPDATRILHSNTLIDIESGKKAVLPDLSEGQPVWNKRYPIASYSFAGLNEAVIVDPYYYIRKYYLNDKKSSTSTTNPNSPQPVKVAEAKPVFDPGAFKSVRSPELDAAIWSKLSLKQMKYVFRGYSLFSSETPLYIFDLQEKRFVLVDSDISMCELSPDEQYIAYVKKGSYEKPGERLVISGIDGVVRKELASEESFSGFAWSPDGNWIAYSSGEKGKNDIWAIRTSGTGREQLTYGMHTTGYLCWSRSGDKIAFSSYEQFTEPLPAIYVINLNMPTSPINIPAPAQGVKAEASSQLRQLLLKETSEVLAASQQR